MSLSENNITALISAGAVLGGVILSQAITSRNTYLERKHKKNILLKQKYEEVSVLYTSSLQWVQRVQASRSIKELQTLSLQIDARKMHSLCLIYFPELRKPVAEYIDSLALFHNSVLNNFHTGEPGTAGAQAFLNTKHGDIFNKSLKIRQSMEDAIEKHVSTYIKF